MKLPTMPSRTVRDAQIAALILLIGAILGLVVSFALSVEALLLASNSRAVLSCDVNAVLSCGSVARHWSASLMGFPNSFIGLMTFPPLIFLAAAFMAKVKFPKWFICLAQFGVLLGLGFAGWMFYMSFVEIGILCPWCLGLDGAMLMIGYGFIRYSTLIRPNADSKIYKFVRNGYDTLLFFSLVVGIVALILAKFGNYLV